jgi:glycosyltransferase involved in cell wall biosynthesis
VITPNFNGAAFLERTILSVLNQSYSSVEYIIIDGGSTDESVDIIKKYEHKLRYWESSKDKGLYHAIQKGFDLAKGDILCWLNSDDIYFPHALSTVAELFSSFPDVSWLTGSTTHINERGAIVYSEKTRHFTKEDFYRGDYKWIQQESTFWRRSLWLEAGSSFNFNLKYACDFDLWMKFFAHEQLYVADIPLGAFCLRSSNQLSLEFFDEYEQEVKYITDNSSSYLNKTQSNEKENILYFYFRKILKKMKRLSNKNPTKIVNIHFNRFTQNFELK